MPPSGPCDVLALTQFTVHPENFVQTTGNGVVIGPIRLPDDVIDGRVVLVVPAILVARVSPQRDQRAIGAQDLDRRKASLIWRARVPSAGRQRAFGAGVLDEHQLGVETRTPLRAMRADVFSVLVIGAGIDSGGLPGGCEVGLGEHLVTGFDHDWCACIFCCSSCRHRPSRRRVLATQSHLE